MVTKNKMTVLAAALLTMALSAPAAYAEDYWGHENHHRHHKSHHDWYDRYDRYDRRPVYVKPAYGQIVFSLPQGSISVNVGVQRYQYCEGVYYRRFDHGYVVVAPPVHVFAERECLR